MIVQALIAHPPAATDEFFRGRIDQMIDLGAVLRHAAEVEHKSLTDFILDAAYFYATHARHRGGVDRTEPSSSATGTVWPGTTA